MREAAENSLITSAFNSLPWGFQTSTFSRTEKGAAVKILLALLLLITSSTAWADPWMDRQKQAQRYAAFLIKPPLGKMYDRQEAETLMRAADILTHNDDCHGTFYLREWAFGLGLPMNLENLRRLYANAHCEGKEEKALKIAFLLLEKTEDPKERGKLLADIGKLAQSPTLDGDRVENLKLAVEALRRANELVDDPFLVNDLRKARKKLDRLISGSWEILGVEADRGEAGARICIRFSQEIPDESRFRYRDYVEITPPFEGVYQVISWNDSLCIDGADYSTTYTLVVREGMRYKKRTLKERYQAEVTTPARAPAFWFDRSDYLLPAGTGRRIPLYTINMEKLQLRLVRIDERNILTPFVQAHFQKDINDKALQRLSQEVGEILWEHTIEVQGELNQVTATPVVLPETLIGDPGLYVLVALVPEEEIDIWTPVVHKAQWLVVSDIGLTLYRDREAAWVVARSLATGRPLEGVTLTLYTLSNRPLATEVTDAQGKARFDAGLFAGRGSQAVVELLATSPKGGLAFLHLNRPALDLSDRGVAGRPSPGPLDLYGYTEQGVYRPGDRLHAVGLLRDDRGQPVPPLPLTLRLLDPTGKVVKEQSLAAEPSGAYLFTHDLSPDARMGRWEIAWYADREGAPVGTTHFQVEAVKPPRLEARLTLANDPQARRAQAELQADYLYGAPAGDRQASIAVRHRPEPHPFADYRRYHFLPLDLDPPLGWQQTFEGRTDAQGKARFEIPWGELIQGDYPQRLEVRAEVTDADGSVVTTRKHLLLHHLPHYIGIEPPNPDGRVPADQTTEVKVVVLDPRGNPMAAKGLRWRLTHIQWDFQWYRQDGTWRWRRVERLLPSSAGTLDLAEAQPVSLPLKLEEGAYRLEVSDPQGNQWVGIQLIAGDERPGGADTPDAVRLELDRSAYRPGDTVTLKIRAPFDGTASLVLANERVHQIREVTLDQGEATVRLPADGAWGAGVYALVSAYRPAGGDARGIDRAVGVVWIPIDPSDQRLAVEMTLPATTLPERTLTVPIEVQGFEPGDQVHLTLAAVDDAVLQLTGHQAPDPLAHFFSQRRLGVRLLDLYGNIIKMPEERADPTRTGAGATATSGRRGMPTSNIRLLSRFSGILTADDQGRLQVPIALPDFNGRVRLMAVAWSGRRLGSAQATVQVRSPLVVSPSLPRFLTVGDESRISVLLQNFEAPPGDYHLTLHGDDRVTAVTPFHLQVKLPQGGRAVVNLPVTALQPGTAHLSLSVAGPKGYREVKSLLLGVRGLVLPQVEQRFTSLAPGATLELTPAQLDAFYPQTARLRVQLTSRPALDVPALLEALERYPYGCLEQLTSRALPLLYYNELARRWGLPQEPDLEARLETAIGRILDKQRPDGSFGLWSDTDATEPWLTLYALEFLIRAREQGLYVPPWALEKGLTWVNDELLLQDAAGAEGIAIQAYGLYLSALAGTGSEERLRYFLDRHADELPSDLSRVQLGAALRLQGLDEMAAPLFENLIGRRDPRLATVHDYGSPLRDLAAVVEIMHGNDRSDQAEGLLDQLSELRRQRRWLSTQEQAWLTLAARHVTPGAPMALARDGRPLALDGDLFQLTLEGTHFTRPVTLTNRGSQPLGVTIQTEGLPYQYRRRPDQGFHVERLLLDDAGRPIDPDRGKPGDLLLAVIQGRAEAPGAHALLVADLIPAGMEIATASPDPELLEAAGIETSTTRYQEALDDRYVAALDLSARQRRFTLAYLLRVVVPGRYQWPAVEVEAMYRPYLRGSGTPSEVQIPQRP